MNQLLKIKSLVLFTMVLTGSFFACNSSKTDVQSSNISINAPIPALAKAYTEFEIDLVQENVLEMPSGTKITLAANSLVDANGNPVTGNATLQYREYHDAVDVLLSGIPMDYEALGKKRTMQTAGMFDINALQNGQALFVKEGEGIQVDFASYEEGTDYNFFALDKNKGWEFVDYVAPVANEGRAKIAKEISDLEKKMKGNQQRNFVFNYNAILDVEYNNNWFDIDKNKNNTTLKSKVGQYNLDYYKSSLYMIVEFEGNKYPADMMVWKNKTTKKWPSWVKNQTCELSIAKKSGKVYALTAKVEGKSFKADIELVVPLKYLFQYSPKEWAKNSKNVMKDISEKEAKYKLELEELRKRQEQQAAVIRSFQVAGFGIYNYDKLIKEENRIDIIADFKLKDAAPLDYVLCLTEDNKTVINYPKSDWNKVTLLPGNKARFISILPNKSIALYSAEQYQKLSFETLKGKTQKPALAFELVQVLDNVTSEDEIRSLLNI